MEFRPSAKQNKHSISCGIIINKNIDPIESWFQKKPFFRYCI